MTQIESFIPILISISIGILALMGIREFVKESSALLKRRKFQ